MDQPTAPGPAAIGDNAQDLDELTPSPEHSLADTGKTRELALLEEIAAATRRTAEDVGAIRAMADGFAAGMQQQITEQIESGGLMGLFSGKS